MLRTLVRTRLILSLALDHSLAVHGTESHMSRCSSDCAANTLCEALALSDMPESKEVSEEYELDDLFSGCSSCVIQPILRTLGPNSIEKFQLEFWLEKPLEFCLEIPYTKKMFKIG